VISLTQRWPAAIVALSAIGITLALGACGNSSQSAASAMPAAEASPYKPAATFQEIMDSIVDPAGDFVWKAVSTTVDAKGIHEVRPTTDAEWHALRQRAIMLVEAANLIAVPGRRVARGNRTIEEPGDLDVVHIQQRLDTQHDQLVGFAGALRNIGLKLVDAVDRKDVDAFTEHGGTLDEVCEECHKVFWYPDQPQPSDRSTDAKTKQ
jgi:hypothetical protein